MSAITRPDSEFLPVHDRLELVKTAILMVDEGVDHFAQEMQEEVNDFGIEHLEAIEEMRTDAYASLLLTMSLGKEDAIELTKLMALDMMEDDEEVWYDE